MRNSTAFGGGEALEAGKSRLPAVEVPCAAEAADRAAEAVERAAEAVERSDSPSPPPNETAAGLALV